MSTLATLIVDLQANTSNFHAGLAGAKSDIEGFAFQAASGMNAIGGGLLAGVGIAATAIGVGLAGAFKSVMDETNIYQKAQAQTEAVLKSTGGVAGVTADMVTQLADKYSGLTLFQDDVVQGGENLLLTFTKINQDIFPQATGLMLDMSQALGQDLKSSAIQLGKALQDPVLGMTALRRVGVDFSAEDKKIVEQMVKTGHTAEAQKYIMAELTREFGGSAEAAGKTFAGQLEILGHQLNDTKQSIGMAMMPALTQLAQFLNTEFNKPEAQEFMKNLAKSVGDFAETVVSKLPGVIQWFQQVFGWLEENKGILIGVFAALGSTIALFVWTTVIPAFIALLPAIAVMALIGVAAYLLYQAWTTNFGGIQQKVAEVWAFLQPILKDLWSWLQNNIPIALQKLSGFITNVQATFAGIGSQISAWFSENQGLISTYAAAIEKAFTIIGQVFINNILPAILGLWNVVSPILSGLVTLILGTVKLFMQISLGDWAGAWNTLKETVVSVGMALGTAVINLLNWIAGLFGTSLSGIGQWWSNTWKGLLTNLQTIWGNITGWFSEASNAVISPFAQLWENVLLPALQAVYNFLGPFINLWNAIGDLFSTVIGIALTAVAGIWQNVLLPAIMLVVDFIAGIAMAVWDRLLVAWNLILDIILSVTAVIISALRTAWQPIADAIDVTRSSVEKVSGSISTTLQSAWSGLVSYYQSNIKPMFIWLNEYIGKNVYDSWNNIITIINGVTDSIKTLTSNLKGLKLPSWMTPGSPTPWELGLLGVADALHILSNAKLPSFSMALGGLQPALANAVSMPAVSVPAVSGAAATGGNTSSELMRDFQDALNEFNMRLRTLPDDLARSNNSVLTKIAQRA